MIRKLILAVALSLLSSGAFAACTNPMAITANAGTVNMSVSQNTADAGCMYNVTPNQGGAPLSATNGWWSNILQGNAALSATNGIYANILQGNAVNSLSNPFFVSPATGSVWPVSVASLPLPSGAATSANQATEITSLGTIATNSGTQATAANQATANTSAATTATNTGTTNTEIGAGSTSPCATPTTSCNLNQLLQLIAQTAATPGTLSSQYPSGATAITASATGTTAATTATLAGTTGKTTYVCGYSIRANATANTNVTNTLTGVITGTMSSAMWVPANTAGLGVDEQIFSPCIPASATNTGIAAVSGAPGAGGVVTVKAWGYQL